MAETMHTDCDRGDEHVDPAPSLCDGGSAGIKEEGGQVVNPKLLELLALSDGSHEELPQL